MSFSNVLMIFFVRPNRLIEEHGKGTDWNLNFLIEYFLFFKNIFNAKFFKYIFTFIIRNAFFQFIENLKG